MVEHILGKDEVISSTLISSSNENRIAEPFVSNSRTALFYPVLDFVRHCRSDMKSKPLRHILTVQCVMPAALIRTAWSHTVIQALTIALAALKETGYPTYKLRQMKLSGERDIQNIRKGEIVNADDLAKICGALHCQSGDIMEYSEDQPEEGEDIQ